MDQTTYEQFTVPAEIMGDSGKWLSDDLTVDILKINGQALAVLLPTEITLRVSAIEPVASNSSINQATLDNGTVLAVPKQVNVGDRVIVNPYTSTYSACKPNR